MSAEANKERKLRARSDQVKLKNNSYEAIKCFVSQTNFDVPDLGYPDFLIIWTFLCVPKCLWWISLCLYYICWLAQL